MLVAPALCCGAGAAVSAAESGARDTGTVAVAVTDAQTGKRLVSRVVLRGDVTITDISDTRDDVVFAGIPEGRYRVAVSRAGYRALLSEPFEVLAGRRVDVAARLVAAAAQLRVIGTVQIRQSAPADTSTLTARSTAVALAPTLAEALGAVPGVQLAQDDTPLAGQYVSLDGHPAGQTGLSLDGIPLSAPGTATDVSGLSSDLFASSTVSFGASAGAPAGTVAFRTLAPTRIWQGRVNASYGSFDRGALSVSETGTAGNLGIAIVHAARSTPSLADDARFADQTGLDYAHPGENRSTGDLVSLRYRAGAATTFATTLLRSSRDLDLICLQVSAALPCGYGPGNRAHSAFELASLSALGTAGRATVQVTAYARTSNVTADLLQRRIDGAQAPFEALAQSSTRGAFALIALGAGPHDVVLRYDTVASATSGRGGAPGTTSSFSLDRVSQQIDLSDRVRLGPVMSLALGVNGASTSALPRGVLANATLAWRPTRAQTVTLRTDAGTIVTPDGRTGLLTDPQGLSFDCASGTARGYVPGDAATRASLASVRLGWDGTSRWATFGVQGRLEVQRNTVIDALVSAAALPDASFPAGYFDAVSQAASERVRCGEGTQIPRARVYVDTPVAGVDVRYASLRAGGTLRVAPHVAIEPSFELLRATLRSADPRLNDPRDVSRPGAQLAGVPAQRAALYASWRPQDERGVQLLLGATYTGKNNRANLPAYALVDAGIAYPLAYGTLVASVRNVFNTDAGVFASPLGALPYTDAAGLRIGTLARPATPRAVTLSYSAGVGRGARAGSADLRGDAGVSASAPGTLVPGLLVTRLAASRPADPFERNPGTACTAEFARVTDSAVDAIRAYLAQPAVQQLAAPFDRSPVPLPQIGGVVTTFSGSAKTYSLVFTTSRLDFAQGVSSCVHLSVAEPAEAVERGLFVPSGASFFQSTIAFSPSAGFYVVNLPPASGTLQKFRTFALPAAPPAQPFRLQPPPVCESPAREIATTALAELERYFAQPGRPSGSTPAWTIERVTDGASTSYAVRSNQISAIAAVLNCGYVAGAPRDELRRRGVSAAALPALNYAAPLGLYVVTAP
ncbi:MAG: hypothetical protein QOD51_1544 [Candidatus Eremiobacteraeota bacterium]|nr:hypothetical protein [Candidatus Eremiobacteraeota bacterium]